MLWALTSGSQCAPWGCGPPPTSRPQARPPRLGRAGSSLGGQGRGLADGPFQREAAHYLGYVYFRQVKDSSVKRGYFQKVSLLAALGGTAEGGG